MLVWCHFYGGGSLLRGNIRKTRPNFWSLLLLIWEKNVTSTWMGFTVKNYFTFCKKILLCTQTPYITVGPIPDPTYLLWSDRIREAQWSCYHHQLHGRKKQLLYSCFMQITGEVSSFWQRRVNSGSGITSLGQHPPHGVELSCTKVLTRVVMLLPEFTYSLPNRTDLSFELGCMKFVMPRFCDTASRVHIFSPKQN